MSIEKKLVSCLKAVGLNPKMDKFSNRKKMQKIVYLMRYTGVDFPFNFSWYFRGPYSSRLADSLYTIVRTNISDEEELAEKELSKIQEIRDFLGDNIHSADYLELLASILYLKRRSSEVGASDEEVLIAIKENKPYFSSKEIRNCLEDAVRFEKLFLN